MLADVKWAEDFAVRTDIISNLRHNFKISHTPKQEEVLREIGSWKYPRYAIKSVHGWGKTFVASDVVVDWLSRQPQPLVITTAPTDRQIRTILWKEIKRKARPVAKQYGWEVLPDAAIIKKDDETIALGFSTTDESRFEGYHEEIMDADGKTQGQLLAVVDEAKGVHDRIFEAIDTTNPALLLYISTPGLPVGRFYEAFKPTNHVERGGLWKTMTISGEVVNEEVGERVKMSWLKMMATEYGKDSPVYQRRVLAEFSVISERPYFDADGVDTAREIMLPATKPHVLGVDWGKRVDFTAIVEIKGHHVLPTIIHTQQDYMVTVDMIEEWHEKDPFDAIVSDLGAGEAQVEEMERRRLPVEGFRFTTRSKLDIMSNLKLLLESNKLDLPDHEELIFQLKCFEQIPRADGSIKLTHPEGHHDDLVDALALAVSKLTQSRRRVRRPAFPGARRVAPSRDPLRRSG